MTWCKRCDRLFAVAEVSGPGLFANCPGWVLALSFARRRAATSWAARFPAPRFRQGGCTAANYRWRFPGWRSAVAESTIRFSDFEFIRRRRCSVPWRPRAARAVSILIRRSRFGCFGPAFPR